MQILPKMTPVIQKFIKVVHQVQAACAINRTLGNMLDRET